MFTVTVNPDPIKAALADMSRELVEASSEAIRVALETAKRFGVLRVSQTTKRRTGRLLDSFQEVQLSATKGKLFNLAPYARYVNDGTPAHMIRAKKARCLRFESGGRIVFRQAVHHPGTKARPFEQPAANAGEVAMTGMLRQAVDRIARKVGG